MLRVIGAGFGRTGTASLKTALETLGLGPCYHMTEVFRNPAHNALWEAANDAPDPSAFAWEGIFDGYGAAVDWPACAFYEPLMARYPEAKVILTVRDPEGWYESARQTIHFGVPEAAGPSLDPGDRMRDRIIWQGVFGGRFDDREHALSVFRRHLEEVQRRVPPDRLLVYDVRDGWEPLCRFLGVPVPVGTAFPHRNTSEEWMRRREAGEPAAPAPDRAGGLTPSVPAAIQSAGQPAAGLQVIGAGFGRTGTFTLKTVLDALGFGPCYHMFEVDRNPGHDDLWKLAADDPDFRWDLIFGDHYRSAVDWPVAAFYDRLMAYYPQSKVVLTVRDPESWYESARTTIARRHFEANDIATSDRMPDKIIWRGVFDGCFADKEHALAVYQRHIDEVERRVPASRLLVYDAQEGWGPICRFLGVDEPDTPFPHVNTGDEWRARLGAEGQAKEDEAVS